MVILPAVNASFEATGTYVRAETPTMPPLWPEGDGWTVAFAQGDASSLAPGVNDLLVSFFAL